MADMVVVSYGTEVQSLHVDHPGHLPVLMSSKLGFRTELDTLLLCRGERIDDPDNRYIGIMVFRGSTWHWSS